MYRRRRHHRHRIILLIASLSLVLFASCGGDGINNPENAPILLGSFYSTYNPDNHEVTIQPVEQSLSGLKVGSKLGSLGPLYSLDTGDSLLASDGRVLAENCAPSDWNNATKVLSVNYKITHCCPV